MIPQELRDLDQWMIAADDGKPRNRFRQSCNPHDGSGWMSYAEARQIADGVGWHVGFCISEHDPYCCIDLDVKNEHNEPNPVLWTPQEKIDRHLSILKTFASFTEVSRHGQGLHIWTRGAIGFGAKRDSVEVYSQERFMICTGNVLPGYDLPILDRQELLETLVGEMRFGKAGKYELVELEEVEEDWVIWERAKSADNGGKFAELCNGDWHAMGYPSQSEADLALMSIFAFYSPSNEQCRRLFRMTGLGAREKATKNNYHLNLCLKRIRQRMESEAKESKATEQMARDMVALLNAKSKESIAENPGEVAYTEINSMGEAHIVMRDYKLDDGSELNWPPGFIGHLARYIYNSSIRPVKEVSIVSAIGLMAGICGKAWNIPQSGLNMYIVLVARSGVGKEAMHYGINKIISQMALTVPDISRFVDFNEYVSGPALMKAVHTEPSMVNVSGEWGRRIQRLAHDNQNGPMTQLRTVMTNLYQKSDAGSMVGGLGYSDKNLNVGSASGIAYSMIGETTPDTFYESLTDSMMEDGFLSRFTMVEYTGDRPAKNLKLAGDLDDSSKQYLAGLVGQARLLIMSGRVQMVTYSPEADTALADFDLLCDQSINANENEAIRQLWNRAHLKSCRMAALLAVADNYINPVVSLEHAQWAMTLVRKDMNVMFKRWKEGAIGRDDEARLRRVISYVVEYFSNNVKRYAISNLKVRAAGYIPASDLQKRMCNVAAFKSYKLGSTRALKDTINNMLEIGYLVEAPKEQLLEFKFRGKAYVPTPQLVDYFKEFNALEQAENEDEES